MSWDDDDFERELIAYSELETVPKELAEASVPKTIRQYQQRIQSNNSTSIFDADYTLDRPSGNTAFRSTEIVNGDPSKVNENFEDDLDVFKDETVRYVVSGRGRGGRNIILPPGQFNRNKAFSEEEEIRRQLRKVAPIGFSNEVTENAVRAHHLAKAMEQSANSSPVKQKADSPSVSKTSSELHISPTKSKTESILNIASPRSSGQSSPSTASDVQISDYFTSQDYSVSPSSLKSNQNRNDDLGASTAFASKTEPPSEVSTGAIPKRPVPLSIMLKQSRESHRKKQIELQQGLSNGYSKKDEDELASKRKIQEILLQDHLEREIRKKQLSDKSSNSTVSSVEDVLPWRQRNNSPPRYAWGQKREKQLDINSMLDFPSLK